LKGDKAMELTNKFPNK